jgi:hypothetical protein
MTDKLPPNLLALFAPRPPLRYLDPPDHAPQERRTIPVSGVAQYLPALDEYKETDVYEPTESWLQMKDRRKRERKEQVEKLLTEGPKNCEISVLSSVVAGSQTNMSFCHSQTSRRPQYQGRPVQDVDRRAAEL